MALSSNLYALLLQRLEMILAQTPAPKVPEWPSHGNLSKVTLNPHFPKKWKGRTKGNFSKITQKVPLLKKPQKTLNQMAYPLTSMRLNYKDWRRFRSKQRLQKCPNDQVMAIFARSPKTCIF